MADDDRDLIAFAVRHGHVRSAVRVPKSIRVLIDGGLGPADAQEYGYLGLQIWCRCTNFLALLPNDDQTLAIFFQIATNVIAKRVNSCQIISTCYILLLVFKCWQTSNYERVRNYFRMCVQRFVESIAQI